MKIIVTVKIRLTCRVEILFRAFHLYAWEEASMCLYDCSRGRCSNKASWFTMSQRMGKFHWSLNPIAISLEKLQLKTSRTFRKPMGTSAYDVIGKGKERNSLQWNAEIIGLACCFRSCSNFFSLVSHGLCKNTPQTATSPRGITKSSLNFQNCEQFTMRDVIK